MTPSSNLPVVAPPELTVADIFVRRAHRSSSTRAAEEYYDTHFIDEKTKVQILRYLIMKAW